MDKQGQGMLVLSRKHNEKIVIAGGIEIQVVEIGRGKVRLGIVAPGLEVHREEVWRRKHVEQLE